MTIEDRIDQLEKRFNPETIQKVMVDAIAQCEANSREKHANDYWHNHYAGLAMQALIAELSFVHADGMPFTGSGTDMHLQYDRISNIAYKMADAMLKEKEKANANHN